MYNTNKDLSTSSLLFRRSFASFAIRNFGIHVLCLSSFSLRGGREKHRTSSGFAAGWVPSPNPGCTKPWFFPPSTPAPTQTQTWARFVEVHAAATIIWQPGMRHAVSINSNFSDEELARTALFISTGSWAFPSLEKRPQLCRVAVSSSLLFTSLALCNVKEAFGGGCFLPNQTHKQGASGLSPEERVLTRSWPSRHCRVPRRLISLASAGRTPPHLGSFCSVSASSYTMSSWETSAGTQRQQRTLLGKVIPGAALKVIYCRRELRVLQVTQLKG